VADDDGEDEVVAGAAEDLVAVHVAPLVAGRRTAEVVGVPVLDALAAVPVVMVDAVPLSPVVVADVMLLLMVVVVVIAVVGMVLGDGDGPDEGKGDSRNSKSSGKTIHGLSSGAWIPG
jgi:hypothetical protein